MKSEHTLLRLVWAVTVAAEYEPSVSDMGPHLIPLCTILSLHRNRLVRILGTDVRHRKYRNQNLHCVFIYTIATHFVAKMNC